MSKVNRFVDLILWRLHIVYRDPLDVAHDFLGFVWSGPLQTNPFVLFLGNTFRVYLVILISLTAIKLFHINDIWQGANIIEGFMIALQVKERERERIALFYFFFFRQ